jgi:hypothetical protein
MYPGRRVHSTPGQKCPIPLIQALEGSVRLLLIRWRDAKEEVTVLAKETCPKCKGQRYVKVQLPKGQADFRKCPDCNGVGYKIRKMAAC